MYLNMSWYSQMTLKYPICYNFMILMTSKKKVTFCIGDGSFKLKNRLYFSAEWPKLGLILKLIQFSIDLDADF